MLFFFFGVKAQIAHDLTIFSEDAQKFTVTINGEVMNDEPRANVKIENTEHDYCQIIIAFENQDIPPIKKKALLISDPGQQTGIPVSTVYRIKKKKGEYKLGFVSRSPKKIQKSTIIIDH